MAMILAVRIYGKWDHTQHQILSSRLRLQHLELAPFLYPKHMLEVLERIDLHHLQPHEPVLWPKCNHADAGDFIVVAQRVGPPAIFNIHGSVPGLDYRHQPLAPIRFINFTPKPRTLPTQRYQPLSH